MRPDPNYYIYYIPVAVIAVFASIPTLYGICYLLTTPLLQRRIGYCSIHIKALALLLREMYLGAISRLNRYDECLYQAKYGVWKKEKC